MGEGVVCKVWGWSLDWRGEGGCFNRVVAG